ncbi:paraquat-inducible protein A [Conchiformibius kuhniae]|uniref:PqiA/YebS family transporter subunit n=1 Tax=Conchiformibius kuhniae TaxID=211502 RepID=A0ABD8B7S4_9NEIS|nr:paraquat-inducible protein A [Conchiformibius kuhniae]
MKFLVRTAARRAQQKWLRRYLPAATLPAHAVDCPECGLRVSLPKLRQGQQADCPRCGHHLVRVEHNPYLLPLALALTGLILMALVYGQLFVTVTLGSVYSPLTLPEMVLSLMGQNDGFLGTVLFVFTFGVPVLFLLMCLYVYGSMLAQQPFPYVLYMTRALTRLRHWMMVDVFFISILVAYIKMSSVGEVHFHAAFWLLPVLALVLLRTVVAVPEHWVYHQIRRREHPDLLHPEGRAHTCCTRCLYFRPASERECAICGSDVFDRRPHSLKLSFCFLLAAAILYIPANTLPIMISENPLSREVSTIISGIMFMWRDGDKMIAVIIFSASIAVPTLKIISMALLLYSAKVRPLMRVERLSWQYRLTEAVGRWSMIDIFVIIILMSAYHSPIARVTPGPAAIYFCLVVLLTMWSAYFFDVRLIWDWQTRDGADFRQPESENNGKQKRYLRFF